MQHHYIFYKPYGVLSQFIYNGKRKSRKRLLNEFYNFAFGTMAIGRLDEDSEGLLLLSTDGMQSQKVRSKSIEKEYYVQVDGIIDSDTIRNLQNGVIISIKGKHYKTLPCKAVIIETPKLPQRGKKIRDERHGPTSWLSITLTEGKYRQVRKMTAAVGFPTLRLVRVRIDQWEIGNLKPGEVQKTSPFI